MDVVEVYAAVGAEEGRDGDEVVRCSGELCGVRREFEFRLGGRGGGGGKEGRSKLDDAFRAHVIANGVERLGELPHKRLANETNTDDADDCSCWVARGIKSGCLRIMRCKTRWREGGIVAIVALITVLWASISSIGSSTVV